MQCYHISKTTSDSKVHVAHVGPTWDLSAPGGPHVGPINFAIRDHAAKISLELQ